MTRVMTLLIPIMMISFSIPIRADIPPDIGIFLPEEEFEDPITESQELYVTVNNETGQIIVETFISQWSVIYIVCTDNNVIYSVDTMCESLRGTIYYTNTPAIPGHYCIIFQNPLNVEFGFFTID